MHVDADAIAQVDERRDRREATGAHVHAARAAFAQRDDGRRCGGARADQTCDLGRRDAELTQRADESADIGVDPVRSGVRAQPQCVHGSREFGTTIATSGGRESALLEGHGQ